MTVHLDFRAFAYYNPAYFQWITEDGEFDILFGASAADIRCTETVTLQSTVELPCNLNRESTIRDWLDYAPAKPVFDPLFQQMKAQMAASFGNDGSDSIIGMDMLGFMLDMPLLGLLEFQEQALPMPADQLVDGMLSQVRAL